MANYDPLSFSQLVDSSGNPAASAKIYFFETGSTTPKAVYSNAGLTSSITQPVRADATGVMPVVFLSAGRYKRVVTTSADVTLSAYAADPIDASLEKFSASAAPSTTYPFLEYHNTSDGHLYRRNSTDSAWIDLGTVDSLGNASTVTQQLAGTATSVFSTPDSVAGLWQRGTDIASASSLSLPSTGGGVFNITGTTTITGIGSASGGRCIRLKFAGALTLTHNASSLVLPTGANITTVAGDCADFVNEAAADATGSNWRCFNYETSDGRILLGATQAQQETGTTQTIPVTPGVQHFHNSACKSWAYVTVSGGTPTLQTSYNVSGITDTGVGLLTISFTTSFSSANWSSVATSEATAGTGNHTTCSAKATGSVVVRNYIEGSPGSIADPTAYSFAGFGDL